MSDEMDASEKLTRAMAYDWEFVGDKITLCHILRTEIIRLRALLGRTDPVQCQACGEVCERDRETCGHCGYRWDGTDIDDAINTVLSL